MIRNRLFSLFLYIIAERMNTSGSSIRSKDQLLLSGNLYMLLSEGLSHHEHFIMFVKTIYSSRSFHLLLFS